MPQYPQDATISPSSSVDNDDNIKNVFDEEEDGFDNDKYSFDDDGCEADISMEMHDNHDDEIVNEVRIKHKCFYYCANMERKHFIGAIVTVVTLIVVVAMTSSTGTATTNNGLASFSMSSWEEACSSSSLDSEDGYKRCYSMCSTFDCCDVPAGYSDSCSSSHSTECNEREMLCNGITVDDVNPYSSEGQSAGDQEQQQPSPGWTEEGQYDGHWENEMQKEIQENVEEAEMHEIEEEQAEETILEIDILEACSGDDPEDCTEVCADHLCCVIEHQQGNDEDEDNNDKDVVSCVDDPEMNCDIYSPCANLLMMPTENLDINVVCSGDSLHDQGLEACQALCMGRICCFVDGDENCQDSMEEVCNEYAVCGDVLADVLAIGVLPVGIGGNDGDGTP